MEKYKDSDVELMSILLKLQEQTSPMAHNGLHAHGTLRTEEDGRDLQEAL